MIFKQQFCKNRLISFITILLLLFYVSPFCITSPQFDLKPWITPVAASSDQSSFHPYAFHSGSGRLHLLFLHEFFSVDIMSPFWYHTYELANGSWAPPKRIKPTWAALLAVVPTEEGFITYWSDDYIQGPAYYLKTRIYEGINKMEYHENRDQWSDPVIPFGVSHIRDFLQLPDQPINCYLHSFFLVEDGSFLVVWSFEISGKDVNLTHKYERTYILSKIDTNGRIVSQPLLELDTKYHPYGYFRIVQYGSSFFLYGFHYTKRVILFSNGTVSLWHDTPLPENLAETLPVTTFSEHVVYMYRDLGLVVPNSAIDIRFLVYHSGAWQILDLGKEYLKPTSFMTPYEIIPGHRPRPFNFVLNLKLNSTTQQIFTTLAFTNTTIELWKFNYLRLYDNVSWQPISSLSYSPTNYYSYRGEEFPIIELIAEGANWRIFWEQEVNNGFPYLYEIFTVTYNSDSNEWSSVTQVTNTSLITDDYWIPESSGFFFPTVLLSLVITVLFLKKLKFDVKRH